jgi:hypothetical protein
MTPRTQGLYRTFSDLSGAFVSMARVIRGVCLLLALVFACLGAARADAFTAAEGRAAADRAAIAWGRDHQQKDGAIVDYVARRPTYGYAALMMGYGLVRAGVRRHDPESVRRGFRAIDAGVRRNNPHRGVFDALANATAYEWVARNLPHDPSFLALRARWQHYLVTIAQPYIGSSNLRRCTVDPVCFHNHEAVGAFGDLQMLRTGLHSRVHGAKLANRAALRASAVHRLAVEIPPAAGSGASFAFGGVRRSGLGLLSDSGTWPLAYHAFSTAMVAGAAADLGLRRAPATTRRALLSTTGALAGMMAPDGDVAYLGRRQETAWALASAIYAATVVQRMPGVGAQQAGELRAVADRAFSRLETVHRNGPGGLGPVPRKLSPGESFRGLDANTATPIALTVFLLNLASDQAAAHGLARPGALPADSQGYFIEPDKMAFAAVRHGDLWYVVHRNRIGYDRRYDFGLVALKQRDARGRWHDVMRPRPNTRGHTHDSAGPVLDVSGTRFLAHGTSIAVRPGGVVLVRGGFQNQEGNFLRRGVTFRFAPVRDGVRMSFPLRRGDEARMTAFMPDGQVRRRGAVIYDSRSSAVVSPAPSSFRFLARRLASCCDSSIVEASALFRAPSDRTYTYTVRAVSGPPAGAAKVPIRRHHEAKPGGGAGAGGGGAAPTWIGAGLAFAAGATLLLTAWRRRRRRRAAIRG